MIVLKNGNHPVRLVSQPINFVNMIKISNHLWSVLTVTSQNITREAIQEIVKETFKPQKKNGGKPKKITDPIEKVCNHLVCSYLQFWF